MHVRYEIPEVWLKYDFARVSQALVDAKSLVLSLRNIPYQRAWADRLQAVQLKQEVAGTSRIEGAEFTEGELDQALGNEGAEEALTRSQKQARAAVNTYRWIASLETDRPIDRDLILEVHRRIVTGCDDDHCPPGELRTSGNNVTFGSPRHRGAEGGRECERAFKGLCHALANDFRGHDILIQALSLHYHLGAMHPFLDGNGRTSRALEALILQRAGLRDALFIALSNYYYDEKTSYLKCLSSVKANGGDLTDFLIFGLKGISSQCQRLLVEINNNIKKALVRDLANELFERMSSARTRVIATRQVAIINFMLERENIEVNETFRQLRHIFKVKEPWGAFVRDIVALDQIRIIDLYADSNSSNKVFMKIRLSWPTEITETEFFERTRQMPRAKTFAHLFRA